MKRIRNYRSRKKQKNHAVVIAEFENEEFEKVFAKEMKKVTRRMRHLMNEKISYEMHLTF